MAKIKIFRGSDHIIKEPSLKLGKLTNDYGRGFYCTKHLEMAKEWACKGQTNGFANEYSLDVGDLKVLNLLDGKHTILNWIALLLKNRSFSIDNEIARTAKSYIIEHFAIDVAQYDVVIGYRADDSYFSYAQSFINNSLPLRSLCEALRLGNLGEQIVLVSEKAFKKLSFINAQPVLKVEYYPKFISRDLNARKAYNEEIKKSPSFKDDIFVMDILREEIDNDDPRIQRIVLK